MFCCYHAVFQGVSQKLNDGVCLYVSVGHSTQHNLHRTRVRILSSMPWLFLAFGFLALSCTPLSGSSLRSTRRSSLFSWSGKDKVARNFVCQPKSAGGFGVVDVLAKFCALHVALDASFLSVVFELDTVFQIVLFAVLWVMTHPLFLLIRLITPQKGL